MVSRVLVAVLPGGLVGVGGVCDRVVPPPGSGPSHGGQACSRSPPPEVGPGAAHRVQGAVCGVDVLQ